jgi:hypothetical protein
VVVRENWTDGRRFEGIERRFDRLYLFMATGSVGLAGLTVQQS